MTGYTARRRSDCRVHPRRERWCRSRQPVRLWTHRPSACRWAADARRELRRRTPIPGRLPQTRTSNSGYCCSGRVTVPVEKLDFYQPIPFGTTAWWESYGRRNQIENVNGILKDKAGLTPGWCRTLNGISRFVGVVMVVIALHLREFKQYELGPDSSDDHETDQDASTSPSDGHKPKERSRDGPA